jgi:hypothetical protein
MKRIFLFSALLATQFAPLGCRSDVIVAKDGSDGGVMGTDGQDGSVVAEAGLDSGVMAADGSDSSAVANDGPDSGVVAEAGPGSGAFKTAITPDIVGCGPGVPACEAPTIQCCFSPGSPGSGTVGGSCVLATGICTDEWELLCDGPEDCSSGMICSGNPASDPSTVCATTPSVYEICHDHTQCPSSAPNCCPVEMNETDGPQLGECDTRTVLTNGACDTP